MDKELKKIIEEFKELGWKFNPYNYPDWMLKESLYFIDKDDYVLTIYKSGINGEDSWFKYEGLIEIQVLRLINRIYKLWEVEV